MPRSTFYRRCNLRATADGSPKKARPKPNRTLSLEERQRVLDVLHEERFVDCSPATVYATLLDEEDYLCSARTMYRILHENQEVRERRNQVSRRNSSKPELLAIAPNQVWSWDITKLKGPEKWTYYYLYVILDIYSRAVVGWLVAPRESAELAKLLIEETCFRQNIDQDTLIIHSDRGPAMTSLKVAQLLAELGITKSLSRPYVSNDNPYSESQFKTLKSRPVFPDRFGCIEDAKAFCRWFFNWYNTMHYHSGIALMTPNAVHYGNAASCNKKRQSVLDAAYLKNPERFVNGPPRTLSLPEAAWINPPEKEEAAAIIAMLKAKNTEFGVPEISITYDTAIIGDVLYSTL